MIVIDLRKQEELDADSKANQQVNFIGNLEQAGNTTVFLIIEETKENIFGFLKGTVRVLSIYYISI